MYFTKVFSYWSLRFRWFWYWAWRDLVLPRYRFARVERLHLNCLAIWLILMWSLGDRLSIKARASSIELILVEVEVLEDLVENPKIVHQVGVCTSWVITVALFLSCYRNFCGKIGGPRGLVGGTHFFQLYRRTLPSAHMILGLHKTPNFTRDFHDWGWVDNLYCAARKDITHGKAEASMKRCHGSTTTP